MKSVLISIQPKWCELIASGKKTVEVRKTRPKIDVPFKVYIYCTQGDALAYPCLNNPQFSIHRMVDSRSLHGRQMTAKEREESDYTFANGKVIGEFVCDKISCLDDDSLFFGLDEISNSQIEEYSCVSLDELFAYKGDKEFLYAWHISDLVIYDKPKELREFHKVGYTETKESVSWLTRDEEKSWQIKRPPQSWCYVEGAEEK